MRALREQPRVVALRAVIVACLVGLGIVVGSQSADDGREVARVEQQSVAFEGALVASQADLMATQDALRRTTRRLADERSRVRALERVNRRTTRALRDARRATRRARRNR